jgi:hypothetical protein
VASGFVGLRAELLSASPVLSMGAWLLFLKTGPVEQVAAELIRSAALLLLALMYSVSEAYLPRFDLLLCASKSDFLTPLSKRLL